MGAMRRRPNVRRVFSPQLSIEDDERRNRSARDLTPSVV